MPFLACETIKMRSGNNYLSSLKKFGAEIWLAGERVGDVTSNSAFRSCSRSIASLYDMQLERPEQMTYRTEDGGRAGLSFIQPRTIDELRKRSRTMKTWADFSGGMMSRSPEYLNVCIAALAAARDFFAASDPQFGGNIANYYQQARKFDWCATLACGDPPRVVDQSRALRVVEKTPEGLVVSGARMLAVNAPLSEELLVLPSSRLQAEPQYESFAIAFAIRCNTRGLKFMCRDAFDPNRSHFDYPLSSRFEQMDCVAIFDSVTVPRDRVFLCGDIARCNALFAETNANTHALHQHVIRITAKAEFMLGLAVRIAQVDGVNSAKVRERIEQMDTTTKVLRAYIAQAEADAALDKWGIMTPARTPLDQAQRLFTNEYPQMIRTIQDIGSSNLVATPSERDFESPMRPDLDRHYGGADTEARERVALHRLAWDATGSAFAGRQTLSEQLKSDVSAGADTKSLSPDLAPFADRIVEFLERTD